jgi:UDP-N-acetylmuramate--alanine ligase
VTGTHGKTSTTSMITTVLLETGADPAYAIGGVLAATGIGAADGSGAYFVAEADESDGSFLMYAPDVAVVTNVEADHLDNYGTEAAYRASFAAFLGRIKPGGLLVTCADDPGTRDLAAQARAMGLRVVSYGESADADYRVTGVATDGMAASFAISAERRPLAGHDRPGPFGRIECDLQLRVPGHHYALNAAAAFAAAVELGIEPERVAAALSSYRGAARRLELKGEAGGVRVVDTYAHHPTELAADLRAARSITAGRGRVIAVFQPHLFSRTRIFAAEFGTALGLADEAVVLDVYAAREDPEPGVTGKLVADAVPGGAARYVPDFGDVPKVVASLAGPGDLVLTMGAGDITKMGPLVLDEIAASGVTRP